MKMQYFIWKLKFLMPWGPTSCLSYMYFLYVSFNLSWDMFNIYKQELPFYIPIFMISELGSFVFHVVERVIGMLLVSRSRLVEDDAVWVFHFYGYHLFSIFLM